MSVRVLIVDDSEVMRKIVEGALRLVVPDLTEVLHATNGIEGLTAIENSATESHPIDLVLCDVHMPTMNGLEFLMEKQRRNLTPDLPMMMMTADACDPQVLKAVAEGAQGYLLKPFTLQQIKTCVGSLGLGAHR